MNVTYLILPTMILAGMLGGAVNFILADEAIEKPLRWWKHLLVGIAAALVVPVFLNMISSDLVSQIKGPTTENGVFSKLLVLDGFCLLAAMSSRTFLRSISDRLLQQVNDYKKQTQEATARVENSLKKVESGVEEAKVLATIAQDAPKVQVAAAPTEKATSTPESFTLDESAAPTIQKGNVPDDPWKGVFGGRRIDKERGRELSAKVIAIESMPGWYAIELRVSSLPDAAPLKSPVQFFVHDTFPNHKPLVDPVHNTATLHLKGWGAFTVGALTDEGKCKLELDLAQLEDAPAEFRAR